MIVATRMRMAAAGAPSEPAVDEFFPGYVAGTPIVLSETPGAFTLTNYTESAGTWALTDPFSAGSILTDDTNIAHARVAVKFRAQPGAGLNISNITLAPTIRYQDASNQWRAERSFGVPDVTCWIAPFEKVAGSDLAIGVVGGVDNLDGTDTTNYQWIAYDVFADTFRAKTWFDSVTEPEGWALGEGDIANTSTTVSNVSTSGGAFVAGMHITGTGIPAGTRIVSVGSGTLTLTKAATATTADLALAADSWLGSNRYRPSTGYGGTTTSGNDNITETGAAGVLAIYGGTIQEIIVTPLTPTTETILWNGQGEVYDDQTQPFGWGRNGSSIGAEMVVTDGPFGDTERVFSCKRLTEGQAPLWGQTIDLRSAVDNVFRTRARPWPGTDEFATTYHVSVWTRGLSIVNSNPGTRLSATFVAKFYTGDGTDTTTTGPSGTENDYHRMLGPGSLSDTGSWAWTLVEFDFTLYGAVERWSPQLGLHDPYITGELQFTRLEIVPVA